MTSRTGVSGLSEPFADPLIGREDDLARLHETLARARLVTLTGPGGSGKTRLARAALDLAHQDDRQTWFVDVSAVEDAAAIAPRIATTIGLDDRTGRDPMELVVDALRDVNALLALDNLEQVADAGSMIARLLVELPILHVVATSRIPLRVRGETEFVVRPLALPADADPASVIASPAGSLYLARVRDFDQGASIDQTTAPDVAELLQRLDGLPLAIELAAARTRAVTPGEINQRLQAMGPVAVDDRSDDRHRSLRAIMEWTIAQLPATDVEVLEATAVCAGFDLDLVRSLVPQHDALPAVEALLALGLVRRTVAIAGTSRFNLLETIRATALGRIPADRRAFLADRHARHFLRLAAGWERSAREGRSGDLRSTFAADADNVRRALDHLEANDTATSLELIARLEPFWRSHGRMREGYERFLRGKARSTTPTIELARAAASQLTAVTFMLRPAELLALSSWTVVVARAVGDDLTRATALRDLALQAHRREDVKASEAAVTELRAIAAKGDLELKPYLLAAEAWHAALVSGTTSDQYVERLRAAIAAHEAAGDAPAHAAFRVNLAGVLYDRGEYEEALAYGKAGAAALKALEHEHEYAWAMALVGKCLMALGRTAAAVEAVLESAAVAIEIGGMQLGDAIESAIPVAIGSGRPELAARLYGGLRGLVDRGELELGTLDQQRADEWLRRARASLPEVALELAVRDGAQADPKELLRSLPVLLKTGDAVAAPAERLRHGNLTKREIEVLTLVGRGRSDPEIAAELFISPKTASVHVANIKSKLDLESRLQIALKARELGLVGTQEPG